MLQEVESDLIRSCCLAWYEVPDHLCQLFKVERLFDLQMGKVTNFSWSDAAFDNLLHKPMNLFSPPHFLKIVVGRK